MFVMSVAKNVLMFASISIALTVSIKSPILMPMIRALKTASPTVFCLNEPDEKISATNRSPRYSMGNHTRFQKFLSSSGVSVPASLLNFTLSYS